MKPSRTIRLVALFVALVGTAGCDQATKHFARTELSRMGPVTLPGRFIELTLAGFNMPHRSELKRPCGLLSLER